MPNKLPKDERQRRPSSDMTTPTTQQENTPDTATDDISANQMEEILTRARQTVKPIINREAANETVSEEVLNFKMR